MNSEDKNSRRKIMDSRKTRLTAGAFLMLCTVIGGILIYNRLLGLVAKKKISGVEPAPV
jgi:hypothetical protein